MKLTVIELQYVCCLGMSDITTATL